MAHWAVRSLCAAAGVAVLATSAQAQSAATETFDLKATELQKLKAAAAAPRPVRFEAVLQEFSGSFNDVASHFEAFRKEFESQGLAAKDLATAPTGILVLYEDPTGKASFRMAVGVQVPARVEVKAPLKTDTFRVNAAARYKHVGPYERLKNVHDALSKQAKGVGKAAPSWPVVLRLLSDPRSVPAARLATEMVVPLS